MKTERTSLLMITVIFFLISSCSSTMVEKKGGLLWKISGNGLKQSSYLFGTAHGGYFIAATYILDSIPFFEDAFFSVNQFIGEKYFPSGNQDIQLMDSTYAELLGKEELAVLDSVLLKYFNTSSDDMKIKPSILTQIIFEKKRFEIVKEMMMAKLVKKKYLDLTDIDELVFISERTMDSDLESKAIKNGYSIIGLDNEINFQFDYFYDGDALSFKQQAENLIKILRNNDLDNMFRVNLSDSIKNAYYEQDLDQIEKISVERYSDSTYFGEIQRKLIFERNFKWMEHIPTLIREKPSFIAVGVRHLPGENGLIDLLRKEGFTVEPL